MNLYNAEKQAWQLAKDILIEAIVQQHGEVYLERFSILCNGLMEQEAVMAITKTADDTILAYLFHVVKNFTFYGQDAACNAAYLITDIGRNEKTKPEQKSEILCFREELRIFSKQYQFFCDSWLTNIR